MVRAYEAVASEFNVLLEPEVVLAGSLQQEWNQRTLQVRARVEDSIGDGRRDE
jgi:hypothetical protein